ncbi:MAG: phenylalanine--tRNA ligase subunit alpha [Candidatus ainarchaeum sp.]|nr:phenylalanine--tRNA ligase subunit alpha [Candidatus ainarchaeum sp.]
MLEEIKQLSIIERKLISKLDYSKKSFSDLAELTSLNIDSVRRASAWLQEKGFAKILEVESEKYFLTVDGKKALENEMPEIIFLNVLKKLGGVASFFDLQKNSKLDSKEFNAALGINKKNAFIIISNGKISLTGVDEENKIVDLKKSLENIFNEKQVSNEEIQELVKRGLIEKKFFIDRRISILEKGINAQKILSNEKVKRVFDVESQVPKIFLGKRAPYLQFLNQIRNKLVALGFNEMDAPLVVSEFYNFDVLFQPQNHPARTWTDSYLLSNPIKGKLLDKKIVNAIKAAHENGGKSKSTGWGYKWSEEIASRLVPTMHGTAHSARQLVNGIDIPKKYFAIARCFRPDVLDATHLLEFNQMEGFIVGENLNFKHLLGMLKDFAIEVAGAEKVKFFPDYYPFTEPSVQLSAKHPEMGWIEFAGAGMFRPEMLENLGIKGEAIAWGMGIDRLAMFKLGIKDIRYLFAEDLGYLRNAKGVFLG